MYVSNVYVGRFVRVRTRTLEHARANTHKHTQVKRLSKFAMNIGLAFQIIDDMYALYVGLVCMPCLC